MGFLIRDLAYLLGLLCDLAAFLLVLEWAIHHLPGPGLNFLRRGLFNLLFPFLEWGEKIFPFQWNGFKVRGLLLAALFWVMGACGVPWLVLLGFSLRS
jgi:hypothetical protein